MNYYELLEISPAASVEVIRNAYKTLAKKYHPDTYRGDIIFAEEKMKLLNEAISVLEDEGKRSEYNKINGITRSGYSEYGRNNLINVDENGEPIFFSYDMEIDIDIGDENPTDEENGGGGGDSYMDIIDEFIKNSRSEPEPKSKKRPPNKPEKKKTNEIIPDEVIADIAADISEANAKKFGTNGGGYSYISEESEEILEDYQDGEPEYVLAGAGGNKPGAGTKSYSDRMKIYYAVLSVFVIAIIILSVLIVRHTDFNNIRDLFSGASGRQDGGGATENPAGASDERPSETEDIYEDIPVFPIEDEDQIPEIPTGDDFIIDMPEEPGTLPPAETQPTTSATAGPTAAPAPIEPTEPAAEPTNTATEEPEITTEPAIEEPPPETETPAENTEEPVTEEPPPETESPEPTIVEPDTTTAEEPGITEIPEETAPGESEISQEN